MAVILGDAGDNHLVGTSVYDVIGGLAGNDIIEGGAGAANELYGGTGDDIFIVAADGDTIVENPNEGDDTVRTALATFLLPSNVENLEHLGSVNFTGRGNSGDNRLTGGTGDDLLIGYAGINYFDGGDGSDTVSYKDASVAVVATTLGGTGGTGSASGGYGGDDHFTNIENIIGTAFNDTLTGGDGSHLYGGAGADMLIVSGGATTLAGGAGNDTYVVNAGSADIVENSGEGVDSVQTSLAAFTLAANVENLTYTGSGNFTGRGNAANNIITGGAGDDVLFGAGGNNDLYGGAGNDTVTYQDAPNAVGVLLGQPANNGFSGGFDNLHDIENVIGSAFNDRIVVSGGTAAGGAGDDVLSGTAGSTLIGGIGDDTYQLTDGTEFIVEQSGEGTDTILTFTVGFTLPTNVENADVRVPVTAIGNALDNVFTGQGGQTFMGLAGNNTYRDYNTVIFNQHQPNNITISYAGAPTAIHVDLNEAYASQNGYGGHDRFVGSGFNIIGSDNNDVIVGDNLANRLTGGLGYDVLGGLDGDDILTGGDGMANEMIGGRGNDIYNVSAVGDTIIELAGEGIDRVITNLATFTLPANVENLTGAGQFLYGNELDNLMQGTGDGTHLIGLAGNNTLRDETGHGSVVADYSAATNAIVANIGTNVVSSNGYGGVDILQGIQNVIGGSGADVLVGGFAADVLDGGAGRDVISGGGGNDVIIGGGGVANELYGGVGNDRYIVTASGDTIVEYANEGTDAVETDLSYFVLPNNVENLVFTGTIGFTGVGNGGNNSLTGGSGDDVLMGGSGDDVITTGAGRDIIAYNTFTDSPIMASGDTITDFVSGTDRIDLRAMAASAGYTLQYIGNSAFTHRTGEVHYYNSGQVTAVEADLNGDGLADFHVILLGVLAPQESDFLL